ncbi:MAG: trypsin-like peptidase domain-containing protein [Rubritalea sp.]|jgi:serine protease Do|tara:strand:+ start:3219 stop:4727 length:1509 start_codon:yes stop_codon:yes gene_type:complete
MQDSYRRFIILFIVLASALLVTIGVRKLSEKPGLFDFLKQNPSASANDTGEYSDLSVTLPETSPVAVSAVPNLTKLSLEYAEIAQAVRPSVVNVDTTGTKRTRVTDRLGRTGSLPKNVKGQGSGVIVSEEGHIITNHHVIADKQQIIITLANEDKYEAKLIAFDPSTDIALLKIESDEKLSPLKFGNSDKVREGHIVLGFGNPFGIGRSVTNGIVSARRSSRSDRQPSLFQTNVAINPGNSGGPLVNVLGEIVGINSSIFSSDKENPSFQGISFAIPSNIVKKTFMDLLEYQRPMRGYLGIYADDIGSPQVREYYNYKEDGGVLVHEVADGSPAAKAGVQQEDIIIEFDQSPITGGADLMTLIQKSAIGKEVEIIVWRENKRETLNAKISQVDVGISTTPALNLSNYQAKSILNAIGIQPINLGPSSVNGVGVRHVLPNSLAAGKILPGDIIYQINNTPIYHVKHFYQVVLSTASTTMTQLYIIRNGKRYSLPIVLEQVNRQ